MDTSAAKAEYMALRIAAQKFVQIARLFAFVIRANRSLQISLQTDNQRAKKLDKNSGSGTQTKHTDTKHRLLPGPGFRKEISTQNYAPVTK